MNSLQWISEKDLDSAIEKLCESARKSLKNVTSRQKKNGVDPFYSLLITNTFEIKQKSDLLELQDKNSALRGMSNAIGNFHQNILGSVSGWENYDSGYDLENLEKKILAEIKNKHNTMNKDNKDKVYSKLQTALELKRGCWKGYLVSILPKKAKYYKERLKKLGSKKELYKNRWYVFL